MAATLQPALQVQLPTQAVGKLHEGLYSNLVEEFFALLPPWRESDQGTFQSYPPLHLSGHTAEFACIGLCLRPALPEPQVPCVLCSCAQRGAMGSRQAQLQMFLCIEGCIVSSCRYPLGFAWCL